MILYVCILSHIKSERPRFSRGNPNLAKGIFSLVFNPVFFFWVYNGRKFRVPHLWFGLFSVKSLPRWSWTVLSLIYLEDLLTFVQYQKWTASSEFGTYRLCEQRRFRRACAVSPEPSLLAHTSSESRGTFGQKARSLAPLNGWACAVEICHDGMLEDTNSLDAAQISASCTLQIRHYSAGQSWCLWFWGISHQLPGHIMFLSRSLGMPNCSYSSLQLISHHIPQKSQNNTCLGYTLSRAFLADREQWYPWTVWMDSWLSFNTKHIRFLRISKSTLFCWTKLMLYIQIFASAARRYSTAFLSRSLGMPKLYHAELEKNK